MSSDSTSRPASWALAGSSGQPRAQARPPGRWRGDRPWLWASALCTLLLSCAPRAGGPGALAGIDLAGFDLSVRPQDDFDAYVNGIWARDTEIPVDKRLWSSNVLLMQASEQNQRVILEELAQQQDIEPGTDAQRVGDFYASFMDTETVDRRGASPVQDLLAGVLAASSIEGVVRLSNEHRALGIAGPVRFMVFPDFADSARYTLYLMQSGLTLPDRSYYLEEGEEYDTLRAALADYAASLFALAGVEGGDARGRAVLELERRLAEHHWPLAETRNIQKTFNPYSRAELASAGGRIDWDSYFTSSGVPGIENVVIEEPSYIAALGDLFVDLPLADWKSYTAFRVLDAAAPYLSRAFVEAHHDFSGRLVGGLEEIPPRWQRGVRSANALLGEAVGKLYVERHFPAVAKERMEELVQHLIETYGEAIDELTWMSEATKLRAQEKRKKLTAKIGYPDSWRDYDGLEIVRGDLLGNVWRASAFEYRRNLDKLGAPIDRDEWSITPQTVNAYYHPGKNEIVFPAAILQPPFFDMAADDAVNYGAIGVVIGHEMGHAFDDQGRHFDGDGNLRDWWSEEDAAAYEKSTAMLVEQYDAFEALPDLNVDGTLTLSENIGDLTGVTIAHRAYLRSLEGDESPVLDGFTGEQRFFLGYAQIWRTKYREETLRQVLLADPHAPSRFRVNGPLRNSPEFYLAFGVTEGDGMWLPPAKRVKIW